MDWYQIVMLVIALYGAFLWTLGQYNKKLPDVWKFIAKQRRIITYGVYILFASIFSVYSIFYVYLISRTDLSIKLWAFTIMMLWAILGIWMPALQRLPNKKLIQKVTGTFHIVFGSLLFVLFWIIKWPDWRTPGILTAFIAIMLLVSLVVYRFEKRKNSKAKRELG